MQKHQVLWADDEIDLLKPHILFLEQKGYEVTPINNGAEAIELCSQRPFDIVFLDENMPGMSGLETLSEIKTRWPHLPAIMITKSEEENIMEDAIGSKIDDYLIKPLNPRQILSSVKKILDNRRLVTEHTNLSYQQAFRQLSIALSDTRTFTEWVDVYKKLVFWELEIQNTENQSMREVIETQKTEANGEFARFITQNYTDWLAPNAHKDPDTPVMSHRLMQEKVLPAVAEHEKEALFFILIDNLRYDQWRTIQDLIEPYFAIEKEECFLSILPTTTSYARNAIFSGLMPEQIHKKYPECWVGDDEDEGKNNHEEQLFEKLLKRQNKKYNFSYHKIIRNQQGREVADKVPNLMNNHINILVYNFVDMLSHARTDTQVLRELAPDDAAYRSLTRSWFKHSPLLDLIKRVAEHKGRLIITTDHGTVKVQKPYKIVGDRTVNTNLRYKQGKNLAFDEKDLFVCRKPESLHLPKPNVSTAYVFTTGDGFFAYPNNYNHYVKYYRDTFQHGGISLEEMIIPYVQLTAR